MTIEEATLTIDYLKEMQESYIEGRGYERHPLPEWYALDKAIEALEQEPNDKYIKEIDHLHKYIAKLETRIVEQDSVLDDVSAEIEEIETYDGIYIDRAYVLQIIDKYKAESEEQMPPERDCVNCVYSKDGHISFSETCHNCMWENQFIPKFMPKRIKASDIKSDDEWMQEDVWDEIYKAESEEIKND